MRREDCFDLVVGDKIRKVRDTKVVDYQEVIVELPIDDQEVHTVTWKGMGETVTDLIKKHDLTFKRKGQTYLKQATISNHFMIKCYELEK